MKLILLGAPGAGKGTQAEIIADKLKLPTISTGNLLREAVKNASDLGLQAKTYMETGKLVPNELVIGLLKDRLQKQDCKNGYILDGFPRTIEQAEALDKLNIQIDWVIDIDVPDQEIKNRVVGRRVCEDCGASYHVESKPPKESEFCDICSGKLVQRKDDQAETVSYRLQVYHSQTEPLKEYYRKQGKYIFIDGKRSIGEISDSILQRLGV